MSTYAIGDIQGCLGAFNSLLERIAFDPDRDRLLLAGDLVSRGEDSLGTLRRIYALRHAVTCVLGNHDLHLLALAAGAANVRPKERDLAEILAAPDRDLLLDWLRQQPLAVALPDFNALLVHAGVPPLWSAADTLARAAEVQAVLRSEQASDFFHAMYGNTPAAWSDDLNGMTRLRVITNYLTRMRFVAMDGAMDLSTKGEADTAPPGFMPWFQHPGRRATDVRILFGHWAALEGRVSESQLEALDTGCVWGGRLTALRLDDNHRFHCDCSPRR
ncbi:symmetrical bis(5'-nucleosyl)-tetraphosphatase [Isoalcanivorax indicus]|uniref:symmetrical bis(5'-nucleosyl)-tetraphosphatase n=1 Tax=Isoalcanivorax indicus TaxID=2202653 RepID=UPI000DB98A6E|nr:symmetrical bis(5'-nucleosyl)-tetraphosphatase [Isoalcanivorax indicus]